MDEKHLELLLDRYFDSQLEPTEKAELETLLLQYPAARKLFWERSGWDTLYHEWGSEHWGRESLKVLPTEPNPRTVVFGPWTRRVAGAAAAAVLVLGGVWIQPRIARFSKELAMTKGEGAPSPETRPQVVGYALLKGAADVEWKDPQEARSVGTLLPAGWLRLNAGTVQLEFLSGARLLLEGPAELRIDSQTEVFCQSGKLSAYVPTQARGFKVQTPQLDLVDLGTAFGLHVQGGQSQEVHVFEGLVELSQRAQSAPAQRIAAGSAIRISPAAGVQQIPVNPRIFPKEEDLVRKHALESKARLEAWKSHAARLARDPATALFWGFEDRPAWNAPLKNEALNAAPESEGVVVGAAACTGRWPGKPALEFKSLGDRLRLNVPGRFESLTLMVWARVDSLPNAYNSLLMPTRYQTGSFQWNIERSGRLRLWIYGTPPNNGSKSAEPFASRVMSSADYGVWQHLVTTYDSPTGTAVHYRDGQVMGQASFPKNLPALLGEMEFGNWGAREDLPEHGWIRNQPENLKTRNFVGRIDELAILSRALDAGEIKAHYEAGKP
jgi:hypothetical protein